MLIAHPSVPSIFVVGMKLIFPNFKIADMTFIISWISSPLKSKSSKAFCKRDNTELKSSRKKMKFIQDMKDVLIYNLSNSKWRLHLILLNPVILIFSIAIICFFSMIWLHSYIYKPNFFVTCFIINQIPFTLKLVQNIKRQRLLIKHCLSYFLKIQQR